MTPAGKELDKAKQKAEESAARVAMLESRHSKVQGADRDPENFKSLAHCAQRRLPVLLIVSYPH